MKIKYIFLTLFIFLIFQTKSEAKMYIYVTSDTAVDTSYVERGIITKLELNENVIARRRIFNPRYDTQIIQINLTDTKVLKIKTDGYGDTINCDKVKLYANKYGVSVKYICP